MSLITHHRAQSHATKTKTKQHNYYFDRMNNDIVKKIGLSRNLVLHITLDWNAVMKKIITSNNTIKLLRLYEMILNPFLYISSVHSNINGSGIEVNLLEHINYQISVGHYIMI